MAECGFWFWFIRPFAEVAAFLVWFLPVAIALLIYAWRVDKKSKGPK